MRDITRVWKATAQIVLLVALCVCVAGVAQDTVEIRVLAEDSLQTAIDLAPDGATLVLVGTEYRENIKIEKSIRLRGQAAEPVRVVGVRPGEPVCWIVGDGEGHTVVQLQNLEMAGAILGACPAKPREVCPHGLLVHGDARVALEDCVITANPDEGVMLLDEAVCIFRDCSISSNLCDGLALLGQSSAELTNTAVSSNDGDGIEVWHTASLSMQDCEVNANAADGILLMSGANADIRSTRITRNKWYGIRLHVDVEPCSCERFGEEPPARWHGQLDGIGNTLYGNREGDLCPSKREYRWPIGF